MRRDHVCHFGGGGCAAGNLRLINRMVRWPRWRGFEPEDVHRINEAIRDGLSTSNIEAKLEGITAEIAGHEAPQAVA